MQKDACIILIVFLLMYNMTGVSSFVWPRRFIYMINITILSDESDIMISEKQRGRCERARLMIDQKKYLPIWMFYTFCI